MSAREISAHHAPGQYIVGAEQEGLKVAVLVDEETELNAESLAPVMSDLCREIGYMDEFGGGDREQLVTDGGTTDAPALRLIEISEELDEIADDVDADHVPESVIATTCRQLSDLCLDMAHELEDEGQTSEDHRLDDDQVLTDGGESPRHPYRDSPLPWEADDKMVRRARIEPGLGDDPVDEDLNEPVDELDFDPDELVQELEESDVRTDGGQPGRTAGEPVRLRDNPGMLFAVLVGAAAWVLFLWWISGGMT